MASKIGVCPDVPSFDVVLYVENPPISCSAQDVLKSSIGEGRQEQHKILTHECAGKIFLRTGLGKAHFSHRVQ